MTKYTMKITSRQKITSYIQNRGTATAVEISRALSITAADARHHLGLLEKDGLIEPLGFQQGRRGRPTKLYRMRDRSAGGSLALLADALLELLPIENVQGELAGNLARKLAGENSGERTVHITRRLAAAVERLNQISYQARWEAHAAGPQVILGYCPYRAIIERHPGLCLMDARLLEILLGMPVEQIARLEKGERGLPVCIFAP